MNDTTKTALSVALAAGLAFAAWFVTPSTKAPLEFSDLGQPFNASFTDPLAARSLEVVGLDESSASYRAFKVESDGQRWVIPSHYNYPADAAQKMADAASAFVGLAKEQVITDSASEHASLGVLAPDDEAAPIKGRGVRITVRGEGGATLADFIIGDEVKSGEAPSEFGAQPTGRRYVRIPGQNRVYATTLKGGLSTKFADWIETDLLQLKDAAVARLEVFRGRIDEKTGRRLDAEQVTITRNAPPPPTPAAPDEPAPPVPATPWSVVAEPGGPPTEAEEVKTERVDEAVNALKALKIVGVRPKPANLAKALGGAADATGVRINSADILNLQSRGFYLTQEGQMLANEGEATIACADGVVYTLWFGEIAQGEGEALSAGLDEPAGEPAKDGGSPKPEGSESASAAGTKGESRYLFVTVSFDEALLGPAPTPPASKPVETKTDAPAKEGDAAPSEQTPQDKMPSGEAVDKPTPDAAPADSAAKEAQPDPATNAAMEEFTRKSAQREAKVKAGKDRAAALSKRFADWWYVIDATAFEKVRPSRAEVIGPKPELNAPAGANPEAGPVAPMLAPPVAPQPAAQPAPELPRE